MLLDGEDSRVRSSPQLWQNLPVAPESPSLPLQLSLFQPETPEPALRPAASAPTAPADALRARLNARLGGRVRQLVLTRNRGQILSARPLADDPVALRVRLDECFVEAPDEALAAVGAWLAGRPRERRLALQTIRAHFERSRGERAAPTARGPSSRLQARGAIHDLEAIATGLLGAHFPADLAVTIGWGAAVPARRRAQRPTLRLGSYSYATRTVTIHPLLDHPSVPRFVVEAVVFHELVHAALPPPASSPQGRRCLHSAEFYAWERRYENHEAAQAWITRNLRKLLARRRRF